MRLFICCLVMGTLCAAETTGVEAILAKDTLEFGDVADLRQAVSTGETAERIAVLDAIAKSGHAEAIDAVHRGLEASEAEVAIAAIRTVEALGQHVRKTLHASGNCSRRLTPNWLPPQLLMWRRPRMIRRSRS